jgi:hypothetical protein
MRSCAASCAAQLMLEVHSGGDACNSTPWHIVKSCRTMSASFLEHKGSTEVEKD